MLVLPRDRISFFSSYSCRQSNQYAYFSFDEDSEESYETTDSEILAKAGDKHRTTRQLLSM